MNAETLLVLHTPEGTAYRFYEVRQFVFRKEKYTPYTELSLTVQDKDGIVPALCVFNRIVFTVNGNNLHEGLADSVDYCIEGGVSVIRIRSRGFTSLLLNNQMVPGLHTAMSINKLMQNYYDFPFPVKWKHDITTCDYIYVKPNRSMWDSVVNLGYKLYDSYPYIRYANEINLDPHEDTSGCMFTKADYLSAGWITNTKGMLSHLHMQDLEGNYGVYNHESPVAESMHIVRHKQIAFDRQYLDDPQRSMELTFSLASKGWRSRYVTVSGYVKLDVNDYVSADGIFFPARISAVTVTGDKNGVFTTYAVYADDFSS
ncbi:MAG: hypothetical protein IJY74_05510 [Oscillospiraceae bacterium]|nr:hypothetical protein [Oscillospiraceae bacterium]